MGKKVYCFPLMSSLLLTGPSPVQYQHGAPALYQGQSGSPPPTGLPRVTLPTNQQAAVVRPTVPLSQGVPQQQQVTGKSQFFLNKIFVLYNILQIEQIYKTI